MAAAVNADANAALSPRATAGEAIGSPHIPNSRTSSPLWNQFFLGTEAERLGAQPPPSESLLTAVVPPPAEAVCEQSIVQAKGGSSPEGYDAETMLEGSENGNNSKKGAWKKPYNAARDSGLVMGAVSWPTLFESTKAPLKPPSADSSKNPNDLAISVPQVTTPDASALLASPSTVPRKQTTSNLSSPNPNTTQHPGRPARNRSMKREVGGNSSSNGGGFSHQVPHSSSAGDTSHANNSPSRASSAISDGSVIRDHGQGSFTRDGGHRSGGDHPQQRQYRRNNSGSHLRGDGSFGGRRDRDRGTHDWNHPRGFNGRDPVVPQQRGGPGRGFIRPLPGAPTYIPPPIRSYGSPMGIPPEIQPIYYYPPQQGMPLVAPMPPAVYYPPLDPQLHAQIVNQIDYYFSNENLVKDTYLRKNMDEHGWVPVQLIASFKKVMQLTSDIQLILIAVQASTVVEVQGDKIRKRDDWMKWIMPPSVQFPAASSSQSPQAPQDALLTHVQGLVLEEKNANDN